MGIKERIESGKRALAIARAVHDHSAVALIQDVLAERNESLCELDAARATVARDMQATIDTLRNALYVVRSDADKLTDNRSDSTADNVRRVTAIWRTADEALLMTRPIIDD